MTGRAKRLWTLLTAMGIVVASCGASCQRPLAVGPFGAQSAVPPHVLMDGASREQIVAAVNRNSARLQSLSATGVSISPSGSLGLPLLNGNIAAERPGRFRLTAGTFTGQELDVGSNDELFWMWVKRNPPPAVLYCRHDQFATSSIRQYMPIEPSWLLAALGMLDIDPASVYDGPRVVRKGRLELRAWLSSASGRLPRVMVIDSQSALVLEQYIYDISGKTLLASSVAESHRFYPVEQVALPERLSIQLPTSGLSFKIDLGNVAINRLSSDPRQLWAMPAFEGYPQYDLSGALPGTPLPGQASPSAFPLTTSPLESVPPPGVQPPSQFGTQGSIYNPPASYAPPSNMLSPGLGR